MNNKTKLKANQSLTVIIVLGILIMANFFSYQIFYRWDITENKDYSISSVSKDIVGNLDDIVNIKMYFSYDLPSQYISLPQEVNDILDEYANYSNGKVKVERIDPTGNEELESQMMILGIPQVQFNVIEKDKLQVAKGYLGIAVQQGEKTEVIPVVQDTQNLEYQISLAIKKVTSSSSPVIGYVTSNSTVSLENEISTAYGELKKLYDVKEIDLSDGKEIPAEITTLVIAGPKDKFDEKELKAIDAFLMKGRSLFFLLDSIKLDQGLSATPIDTGLNTILEKYGLKFDNNLVLDPSSGMASFSSGFFQFSVNYPFWPKILPNNFDQDFTAVSKLQAVILPWASSVEVVENKMDSGNKLSYLLKSSEKAWTQSGNYNLSPQQAFAPVGGQKQYNLGIYAAGKFQSAFGSGSTDNGRIIVIGDSDFLGDRIVSNSQDNLVLFQNLVDSLSLDEDLINIRSKGIQYRPISEVSDAEKAALRYLNIFGVTVLVVVFGFVRYYIRKRNKFTDDLV